MNDAMIERILSCPNLPSLPVVAMRVIELTQRTDVSLEELARTIQNDQALSAKVLKTVNSSFYGLRRRCSTIHGALVMLGLSTVKSLTLGFSLVSAINDGVDGSFDLVAYWRRGLFAAVGARLVANRVKHPHADEAFLGGLLQDLGMMAMYRTLGKRYLRVIPAGAGDHSQLVKVELAELEVQHPEIGARLAERWKLPELLVMPVRYHERPSAAPSQHVGIVRCVALGNIFHDVLTDVEPQPALRRLWARGKAWFDLEPADMDDLVRRANAATREMSHLFRLDAGEFAEAEDILQQAQRRLKELSKSQDIAVSYGPALEALVSDSDQTDPLTGSVGRTELMRRAELVFGESLKGRGPLAVLTVSLDSFADLVRGRGPEAADIALVETAALMMDMFEPGGVVGRVDQATFVVLLPGVTHDRAVHAGAEIRSRLASEACAWGIGSESCPLTASVGAAALEPDSGPVWPAVHELILASARAMEAAGVSGGNCVRALGSSVAA